MLLHSPMENIPEILAGMRSEAAQLIQQITQILWYMRGGVTREEAWQTSFYERKQMLKLIEQNIERTNKSGLPLL
jgi:hypothetical protein